MMGACEPQARARGWCDIGVSQLFSALMRGGEKGSGAEGEASSSDGSDGGGGKGQGNGKRIRLNWRLIQAPDFVRRSVVAHEVTHLVHFDHSPAFHALLGDLYEDDIAVADRWLKQNGRSLYAHFG